MLIQNAINFAIALPEFSAKIDEYDLNADASYQVNANYHRDNATNKHYIKIYFDYGLQGISAKDINVVLEIKTMDSFELISLR
jgi:hypothetical protein